MTKQRTPLESPIPLGGSLGEPSNGDRLQRADGAVATRFSRMMKATTSPIGSLTDPVLVAAATALLVVSALGARATGIPVVDSITTWLLPVPIAIAIAVHISLSKARRRLIRWIADKPFGIVNMNAVLNGLGEEIEISFQGRLPDRDALNERLEAVSPDSFVVQVHEDRSILEVRIGVVESKLNPTGSSHRRFVRVCRIVDEALITTHTTAPIAYVRIK